MNNRQESYRGDTQYGRGPQYDRRRNYAHEPEVNRGDYEMQNDASGRNSEDYGRRKFDERGGFRNYRSESDQPFSGDYSRDDYGSGENYRTGRSDNDERYQARWFNGGFSRSNMGHGFNQQEMDQRDRNAGMNIGRTGDYYPRNGGNAEQPRNEFGQSNSTRGQFAGRGPKGYRRSDERITEDVNEALYQDPDLDASEIEVKVENGVVTLSGTVTERHFKRLAEDIVERCSGVNDVHNQLRVQRQDDSEASQSRTSRTTNDWSQKNAESKITSH